MSATPNDELERLELDRRRVEIEEERLRLEQSGWRTIVKIAAPLLAAVFAVVGSWWVATEQIGRDREAAAERIRDELLLAAVDVVLAAPNCEAAEARARMAEAVMGDALPDDFVKKVQKALRVSAFPEAGLFPFGSTYSQPFGQRPVFFTKEAERRYEKLRRQAQREYAQRLAQARKNRALLCKKLGG